jgi:hypothetical protein
LLGCQSSPSVRQLALKVGKVGFRNIDDQQILFVRRADRVHSRRAVFSGEISDFTELAIADASAGEAHTHPPKITLLLLVDTM